MLNVSKAYARKKFSDAVRYPGISESFVSTRRLGQEARQDYDDEQMLSRYHSEGPAPKIRRKTLLMLLDDDMVLPFRLTDIEEISAECREAAEIRRARLAAV